MSHIPSSAMPHARAAAPQTAPEAPAGSDWKAAIVDKVRGVPNAAWGAGAVGAAVGLAAAVYSLRSDPKPKATPRKRGRAA